MTYLHACEGALPPVVLCLCNFAQNFTFAGTYCSFEHILSLFTKVTVRISLLLTKASIGLVLTKACIPWAAAAAV